MVYKNSSDLPETLRRTLPTDAQKVYIDAYNESMSGNLPTGASDMPRESTAHAVAWQAVERDFVKNEQNGKWYRRGEEPSEEEQSDESIIDKIKNIF